jgi:alginate O-acetyltransferase complex protein AlgI
VTPAGKISSFGQRNLLAGPLVFLLYWLVFNKSLKAQNAFIVLVSLLFYGWWDYRFLSLIGFSIVVDYTIGRLMEEEVRDRHRKGLLLLSLLINLGLLGFFKYYNFFAGNFAAAFTLLGSEISVSSLKIILPVGISFYTFQTLSYTIDVYRRKIEPTRNFIEFAAYVSFFPQLVAGPIERATHLLPQFQRKRSFNPVAANDGARQILWGLFKKVVVADNCAIYANDIFNNSGDYNGSTLVLGAFFFTFQIYCDFSGYSDIAIGTARLFGFDLMKNFSYPYFSRDMAEFWRRWHISLSTWFRDYLYIPLGGSRGGKWMKVRNTFIIFLVSGFWHGANWTFLFWGFLNACYFLPILLSGRNRNNLGVVATGSSLPSVKEGLNMILTFSLAVLAWIFFRAENLEHAFQYLMGIFSADLFAMPMLFDPRGTALTLLMVLLMVALEWIGRIHDFPLQVVETFEWGKRRYFLYGLLVLLIMVMGAFGENQFIYFQF